MAETPRPSHDERVSARRGLVAILVAAVCVLGAIGALVAAFPSNTSAPDGASATAAQDEPGRIERMQGAAERLRGAELGRPVRVERVDRSGVGDLINRLTAQDSDAALTAATDDALHLLGTLTAEQDLQELLTGGLAAQVAGLYDPKSDRLYLVDGGGVTATDSTLLHEIVHAVQDARYDLEGNAFRPRPGDADAQTAAQSVAEGDATEVQERYLQQAGAGAILEELGGAVGQLSQAPAGQRQLPTFLQRSLEFPYTSGATFIRQVRAAGGEAAVDRAFANPPKSTLAIMKPGIWLTGNDTPRAVALPAAPAGAQRTLNTTFGAADIWALVGDQEVAGTWRGGRIAVDRQGDRATMILVIASVRTGPLVAALRRSLPADTVVSSAKGIVTATRSATLG